jgi:hypothetical protein
METDSDETICSKCAKAGRVAICSGCEQSFCTKHFMKHRLYLSEQMDDLYEKYEIFQEDFNRDKFEHPLLSSIYAWERKSMRKIQDIADKAREDVRQCMVKTKTEVKISLDQINSQFEENERLDNFTEVDIQILTKRLEELRNLLEKPSSISIIQDKKSSSIIRGIQIIEQSIPILEIESIESIQEHFVSMFGPCQLSEENRVVTHSNYRAGLSQISGHNSYSSGKHSIDFLIETKGSKNIFFGIQSSSNKTSSTFDHSIHGWWNLDYVIINGESEGGNNNEIIQTGDKVTLIIDCDNQQIQFEHHRTKRLVHLPIKLDVCPFPWKILIRLLNTNDCVRIL